MRKIAIIGGTGIDNPDTLKGFEKKIIETPFGKALCNIGTMSGNQVVFVSRHGVDHSVPPHKVNYRANIWAMKSLGTEEIFATTAVGSLNPEMKAGHFVVCDNVLDFTKSRINTFYDSPKRGVAHCDFTYLCAKRLSNVWRKQILPSISTVFMFAPKARALKVLPKSKCSLCWAVTWLA